MKTNMVTNQKAILFSTKQVVLVGLLSALSYVLMLIHLPFKHLGFLEFEFSDIPAVIAALQYGPLAGILVELIKNLIKALTATTTGMVGELANFLIGTAYILPIGLLYKYRKAKNAANGSINGKASSLQAERKPRSGLYTFATFGVGILSMVVVAALLNYFIMVPLYAKLFGGMEAVVGSASKSVSAISDLGSLIIIGITPFNVVKGVMMSLVGYYTHRLLKRAL